MAHEIINNMMFSVRLTPWHRQGTVLRDAPTTEEAILAAKLDWEVRKAQNYLRVGDEFVEAPSMSVFRTSDDGPIVLGTVTDRYTPVQNVRAFAVFDRIMSEHGYSYETAGAIKNGKKVWILAKAPEGASVGDDHLDKYVLMVTSHDGTANLRLLPTGVRVVCNNTLTLALGRGEDDGFSIRHTGDIDLKLRQAEDALAWSDVNFRKAVDVWQIMADTRIEPMTAVRYFEKVIPALKKRHDDSKAWKRAFDVIGESFMYGRGNRGETLWDAYNALTEWVDHLKGVDNDRIADYAVFGEGARIKREAITVASEVIAETVFAPAMGVN
ncbi:MAG: DUF932 domain-containing protein [Bacteroidia bacterium]|nr:DUF932 domain-containing protein [Bacteroidia bacterium]